MKYRVAASTLTEQIKADNAKMPSRWRRAWRVTALGM